MPVADIKSQAFVKALGEALGDLGFFALVNHGVEQRLIDAAYGAAEAFFALPEDTKAEYELVAMKGQRGFTQFGKEHAKDSDAPDLKEFWHLGRDRATAHPTAYPENIWPREVPQFRPVMTTLFEQLETCAAHLMSACAQYLQQPADLFTYPGQRRQYHSAGDSLSAYPCRCGSSPVSEQPRTKTST